MSGYERDVSAALASLQDLAPDVEIAGAWHREPAFLEALAERIRQGLGRFAGGERTSAPVLLTAHSLPRRVADQEPDYLAQLRETAESVAKRAGLAPDQWTFCWQSAGHEPGEWMKPDFADLMPPLRAAGHRWSWSLRSSSWPTTSRSSTTSTSERVTRPRPPGFGSRGSSP